MKEEEKILDVLIMMICVCVSNTLFSKNKLMHCMYYCLDNGNIQINTHHLQSDQ